MLNWKNIECIVVSIFLAMIILSPITLSFNFRLFGYNLLNARLWAYITIIVIIMGDFKILFSKPIIFCIILLAIFFILEALGYYNLQQEIGIYGRRYNMIETELLPIIVSILLGEHFFRKDYINQLQIIIIVGLILYVLESIFSLIIIQKYPFSVRGTDIVYSSEGLEFKGTMGLGGYSMVSSLPFLIPPLIYYIQINDSFFKSKRFLWFLSLIILILYSFKAVLIAPFLISIAVLILSLIGRARVLANIRFIMLIAIIIFLIPKSWIGNTLYSISELIPNEELKMKLFDIGYSINEGIILEPNIQTSNVIEARATRIPLTLGEFVKNPLLGNGYIIDQHVYWFNYLGQFGLLGFIPLAFALGMYFIRTAKKMELDAKYFYLLIILSFIVLGIIKRLIYFPIFIAGIFLGPAMVYIGNYKTALHPNYNETINK